jgi:maleate isomerase
MPDTLGFRKRIGIVASATNTIVQPELDAMRPHGVTNQLGRIVVQDRLIKNDENFLTLMEDTRAALMDAVDAVMIAKPDHLAMATSAESFWGGLDGSRRLQERLENHTGIGVTLGSEACRAALQKFGGVKRLGIVTPYMPAGDEQVRRFFGECGYEVVALKGLKCQSPAAAAQVSERTLAEAVDTVNDTMVQAIVQVGTNLAMARVAAMAEFWLDTPVIAINTATYWRALRRSGIADKVRGFGALLEEF